jgi:hypothetical protein
MPEPIDYEAQAAAAEELRRRNVALGYQRNIDYYEGVGLTDAAAYEQELYGRMVERFGYDPLAGAASLTDDESTSD